MWWGEDWHTDVKEKPVTTAKPKPKPKPKSNTKSTGR